MEAFLQDCKDGNLESIPVNVDPNCMNGWPLRRAIRYGHQSVWRKLLQYPAIDVNLANKYGLTALHTAARFNVIAAIEDILNHPAIEVNLPTIKGCTPAMVAAKYSSLDALTALVNDKRTDLYALDMQDRSIEEVCCLATRKFHSNLKRELLLVIKTEINTRENARKKRLTLSAALDPSKYLEKLAKEKINRLLDETNELQRLEMQGFQQNMENKSKIFEEEHQRKIELYFQKLEDEKNSFLVRLEKEIHYFLAGLEMKKVLFLNALKDARKCFYHQEHVNLIQFKNKQEKEKSNLIMRERSSQLSRVRKLSQPVREPPQLSHLAVDQKQRPASLSPIPATKIVNNNKGCMSAQPSRCNSPSRSRKTSVDKIVEDTLQKLLEKAEGNDSINQQQGFNLPAAQNLRINTHLAETGQSNNPETTSSNQVLQNILSKIKSKVPLSRQLSNQSDSGTDPPDFSQFQIANLNTQDKQDNQMFQEVSSVQGERVLDPSYPQYHELTKQEPSSNCSSQNPSFQPVNSNIQTTCSYYEPIISTPNQPLHSIYQQMTSSIQSVNSSFQTVIPNQEQERLGHQIVCSSYQLENSKFQIENSIMTNPLVEASKQNENIEKVGLISIGVTQASNMAGASGKTMQYGYLDQTTGLIYYIPFQQENDSRSCTTTTPSPLPSLEFITSNESNDVIDSTSKSYNNINQTHHQPITIPHLAQHPSSGIDVTSQIVTPYMMSNLQYTPIMTTQSNPVTTMAVQSGYGAASSYQQQSVLSQMTGHFGGSPNLSGGSPYLTNLSGGSPNSGNQLGASPNLTGQVGGSPNLGSQLGASPSQIGGPANLGGTPRMMRKPGFMMEILREEEEEDSIMTAEDEEILSITNSAVGSFHTSESFKSLVGDDFKDENVWRSRVNSRSSLLSHTSPENFTQASPDEMFYQEKSLSPEQETLKKVLPCNQTTAACTVLFQLQMPSVTTTFEPQPESAIAGNLVEEGVTVDTDTEDHFRRSTYSVAELEIKQPGRKSTCHIT